MSIRRKNIAFRYMWTAWLNLIRWGAMWALVGLLGFALVTRDPKWFLPAGIAGGVFLFSLFLFVMEASGVRCLGCGGTFLRPMRCGKHESARRILGSYTMHCTLVLATYARSVHCPFCGMRYRISKSTRADKRRQDDQAEERARAEAEAELAANRAKAEAENSPYY